MYNCAHVVMFFNWIIHSSELRTDRSLVVTISWRHQTNNEESGTDESIWETEVFTNNSQAREILRTVSSEEDTLDPDHQIYEGGTKRRWKRNDVRG